MSNWGILTWIGILTAVLIAVIYFKGTTGVANSFGAAGSGFVKALQGPGKYATQP